MRLCSSISRSVFRASVFGVSTLMMGRSYSRMIFVIGCRCSRRAAELAAIGSELSFVLEKAIARWGVRTTSTSAFNDEA